MHHDTIPWATYNWRPTIPPRLQSARLGLMDYPDKPRRPYAVWIGAQRVAENLTRREAETMLVGYNLGSSDSAH
jgi:predicted alpha/beta hydrolase family esterase